MSLHPLPKNIERIGDDLADRAESSDHEVHVPLLVLFRVELQHFFFGPCVKREGYSLIDNDAKNGGSVTLVKAKKSFSFVDHRKGIEAIGVGKHRLFHGQSYPHELKRVGGGKRAHSCNRPTEEEHSLLQERAVIFVEPSSEPIKHCEILSVAEVILWRSEGTSCRCSWNCRAKGS